MSSNRRESVSADRRAFTKQAILTMLSGYIITVSEACSSSPSTPTPPQATADITGNVQNNHGHVATVTAVQINAGSQISINIQGTATHNHTIAFASTDLTSLRNRQALTMTSSTDASHSHVVTFTPA